VTELSVSNVTEVASLRRYCKGFIGSQTVVRVTNYTARNMQYSKQNPWGFLMLKSSINLPVIQKTATIIWWK